MQTRKRTAEDRRYLVFKIGAHVCWWLAFAWAVGLTWARVAADPTTPPGTFERVSSIFIILLMGAAISLGSSLSRMRLARTITDVFEAGMTVAAHAARETYKNDQEDDQ